MKKYLFSFYALLSTLLLSSCASPGTPDGGDYDETPPRLVHTSPAELLTQTKQKKITLTFNEFVKLNNAMDKVVVSPPQLNMPEIKANGKKISVVLQDSLRDNTTYTIDFSDAIEDNNEGNPMGNYAFVFSTGAQLDTMEVAGAVLEASNLEPIKGMLVGLHSNLADSAFQKKPFDRVARTNGQGRFVIKGVAPGSYRVYALNDADGNFAYNQKSEKLAFQTEVISTSCQPAMRNDTLWRDSTHIDTIRQVSYTRFMPDDVVLTAFTAKQTARHLLKTERLTPYNFSLYFTAASAQEPRIKGLNFDEKNAFLIHKNNTNDTLTYWLRDTLMAKNDTLTMQLVYEETNDSTGISFQRTDTLDLISRLSYDRLQKKQTEAFEKWEKQQARMKKAKAKVETIPPFELLEVRYKGGSLLDPDKNIEFTFAEPLERLDTAGIHLLLKKDTVLVEAKHLLLPLADNPLSYRLLGEWRPGQQYTIVIDSAAVRSIYGKENARVEFTTSIPLLDVYSSLFLNLQGLTDTCVVVQLLTSSDKPERSVRCNGKRADFYYVKPGLYYLRLFVDRNANGVWDTGNFETSLQPEEVYYYPTSLQLRARWDVEQDWNVHSVSLIKQKPDNITKQKPDKDKKIQHRNAERRKQ
ncbi:MAG: Ig-like domain-containing protein [Bacteroidaceae bacterium]